MPFRKAHQSFHPDGLLEIPHGARVIDIPEPALLGWTQYCRKLTAKLFARPPGPADILQGAVGDCYLLAALNAILVRPDGQEVICRMMKEDFDGRIIIRFYNDQGTACYVRTTKSYVANPLGLTIANRGANWVAILEKAYAAFLRGGKYTVPGNQKKNFQNTDGIEGGQPLVALKHLVGGSEKMGGENAFAELMLLSTQMQTQAGKTWHDHKRLVAKHIFQDDDPDSPHAARWAYWNVGSVKKENLAFWVSNPTSDEFQRYLRQKGGGLDAETRELVLEWARTVNLKAGAIGSGVYTPHQLDLFARIARALATQRPVAASTKEKLPGKVTGHGHSAGEEEVNGLLASHAYSVVDVKMDEMSRRFICLRNPHGQGWPAKMRTYTETSDRLLQAKAAAGAAEGWIELADFFNNFDTALGVGAQVHTPERAKLMNNLAGQLQAQKLKLKQTAPPPPPQGLGDVAWS